MANKTRAQILAQLYEYCPKVNVTSHNTLTDNLCDLAVEEISLRHNFTYLRANAPATHDITANEYYVDESDFSFTSLKEIMFLQWIKSGTGENAPIDFLPERDFLKRYPYVEYSGNTDGKPIHYTRYANRLFFNCQLDETVTARAFYQKVHGNFTDDNTSHAFQPDNLGFQAIVACVLSEVKEALPGMEVTPAGQQAMSKKEIWIEQLIRYDMVKSNEQIEIEPADKRSGEAGITNPYDWVS
jgi:hypothetical protein